MNNQSLAIVNLDLSLFCIDIYCYLHHAFFHWIEDCSAGETNARVNKASSPSRKDSSPPDYLTSTPGKSPPDYKDQNHSPVEPPSENTTNPVSSEITNTRPESTNVSVVPSAITTNNSENTTNPESS